MSQIIVVADAGRARILRLQVGESSEHGEIFQVVEVEDLLNPDQRVRDSELFTESRPGTRQAGGGGGAHGVDDHRQHHRRELNRQFASEIIQAAVRAADGDKDNGLLLVASPTMLGELRRYSKQLAHEGFEVQDLAKDLIQKPVQELHDYLAARDILPKRHRFL